MALEIRPATEADVSAILVLTARMHAESPRYSTHGFSVDKAEQLIRFLVANQVVLVADRDAELTGFFAGVITEHYLSPDRYATDIGVYVSPEHRGGTTFARLLHAFEKWAKEHGVTELVLGVSTEIHADKTVRMYERMGYKISSFGLIKAGE